MACFTSALDVSGDDVVRLRDVRDSTCGGARAQGYLGEAANTFDFRIVRVEPHPEPPAAAERGELTIHDLITFQLELPNLLPGRGIERLQMTFLSASFSRELAVEDHDAGGIERDLLNLLRRHLRDSSGRHVLRRRNV